MRKPPQPPAPAETLFQFPDGYGYRGPTGRGVDNFGTLRSHQGDNGAGAYRRQDGFATTRSVKKVYL